MDASGVLGLDPSVACTLRAVRAEVGVQVPVLRRVGLAVQRVNVNLQVSSAVLGADRAGDRSFRVPFSGRLLLGPVDEGVRVIGFEIGVHNHIFKERGFSVSKANNRLRDVSNAAGIRVQLKRESDKAAQLPAQAGSQLTRHL